ncbi:DUF2802 domain-containing protein [Rhodocyclaceae bacterium SMB388]
MRELIWLVIVLLFGYVVFQLYRALRIDADRKPEDPAVSARDRIAGAPSVPQNGQTIDRGRSYDVSSPIDAHGMRDLFESAGAAGDIGTSEVSGGALAGNDFQQSLVMRQLRNDVDRLQAGLLDACERVSRLEAMVVGLREQLDAAVATQGVSPAYDEALVFARRGLGVEAIAERCGISVAEAELVRSLAQGGSRGREGA